ncbi:MAG: LptF/LptG family permease [Wolinella sp.]
MGSLKRYIFGSFAQLFFPIFTVLFFISSVILFIKIAGVTFIVKVSFSELFALYLYSLPTLVFFTIPVTFFASSIISLSKLSQEYELPVLFSLGLNPKRLAMIFLPLSLLASVSLLLLSLVLAPLSNESYDRFLEQKKSNVNINLKPAEFGQRLGNWLVYVGDLHDERRYGDVVMFSSGDLDGRESLIVANEASIKNNHGILELQLFGGSAYFEEDSVIKRVNYKEMLLRDMSSGESSRAMGIFGYWAQAFGENPSDRVKRKLSSSVIISLFPILSIFFVPLLGIMHPRFQKNYSYFYVIIAIGIFYALVHLASNYFPFVGILIVSLLWSVSGYVLYHRVIAPYF